MERILPENVFTLIMNEALEAQSQHNTEINANIAHSNNLFRTKAVGAISTLDPVSARSVDKILDQPTGPVNQSGT